MSQVWGWPCCCCLLLRGPACCVGFWQADHHGKSEPRNSTPHKVAEPAACVKMASAKRAAASIASPSSSSPSLARGSRALGAAARSRTHASPSGNPSSIDASPGARDRFSALAGGVFGVSSSFPARGGASPPLGFRRPSAQRWLLRAQIGACMAFGGAAGAWVSTVACVCMGTLAGTAQRLSSKWRTAAVAINSSSTSSSGGAGGGGAGAGGRPGAPAERRTPNDIRYTDPAMAPLRSHQVAVLGLLANFSSLSLERLHSVLRFTTRDGRCAGPAATSSQHALNRSGAQTLLSAAGQCGASLFGEAFTRPLGRWPWCGGARAEVQCHRVHSSKAVSLAASEWTPPGEGRPREQQQARSPCCAGALPRAAPCAGSPPRPRT